MSGGGGRADYDSDGTGHDGLDTTDILAQLLAICGKALDSIAMKPPIVFLSYDRSQKKRFHPHRD